MLDALFELGSDSVEGRRFRSRTGCSSVAGSVSDSEGQAREFGDTLE